MAAIQQHEVEIGAKTTNRYLGAFTAFAVNGDTGNTLKRFRKVAVWKVAHVFSRNRIDNTRAGALDVCRLLQAFADTVNNLLF